MVELDIAKAPNPEKSHAYVYNMILNPETGKYDIYVLARSLEAEGYLRRVSELNGKD